MFNVIPRTRRKYRLKSIDMASPDPLCTHSINCSSFNLESSARDGGMHSRPARERGKLPLVTRYTPEAQRSRPTRLSGSDNSSFSSATRFGSSDLGRKTDHRLKKTSTAPRLRARSEDSPWSEFRPRDWPPERLPVKYLPIHLTTSSNSGPHMVDISTRENRPRGSPCGVLRLPRPPTH